MPVQFASFSATPERKRLKKVIIEKRNMEKSDLYRNPVKTSLERTILQRLPENSQKPQFIAQKCQLVSVWLVKC